MKQLPNKVSSFSPFISDAGGDGHLVLTGQHGQPCSTDGCSDLLILRTNSMGNVVPKVIESSLLDQQVREHQDDVQDAAGGCDFPRGRLPAGAQTDPNSIYRKLYNRNMEFFLWILDREPAPFVFKLHV